MKKKEIIILIVIIVTGIIAYVLLKPSKPATAIKVYHHKEVIATVDPTVNKTYAYKGDQGTFHLEVRNGCYRAIRVDCPNQICVHAGWVKVGEEKDIVCAPNGISVVQESK